MKKYSWNKFTVLLIISLFIGWIPWRKIYSHSINRFIPKATALSMGQSREKSRILHLPPPRAYSFVYVASCMHTCLIRLQVHQTIEWKVLFSLPIVSTSTSIWSMIISVKYRKQIFRKSRHAWRYKKNKLNRRTKFDENINTVRCLDIVEFEFLLKLNRPICVNDNAIRDIYLPYRRSLYHL